MTCSGRSGVRSVAESWRMFANHRDGEWFYPFPDAWYVEAHGRKPEPVLVTELPEDAAGEDVDGFGWIDTVERVGQEPDGIPGMIWPRLFLLEMCFPYGLKAEAERGRGRMVKLRIEPMVSAGGAR